MGTDRPAFFAESELAGLPVPVRSYLALLAANGAMAYEDGRDSALVIWIAKYGFQLALAASAASLLFIDLSTAETAAKLVWPMAAICITYGVRSDHRTTQENGLAQVTSDQMVQLEGLAMRLPVFARLLDLYRERSGLGSVLLADFPSLMVVQDMLDDLASSEAFMQRTLGVGIQGGD